MGQVVGSSRAESPRKRFARRARACDRGQERRLRAHTRAGGNGARALPASLANAALDAARRDSSAQVREAAIVSLGFLGGANALAAARESMRDSSYAVQAAATAVLIRLDPANRASLIAHALSTDSYRDVIRNAALDGIARVGDPAYTATLDTLRAVSPRVASTLAVLAVRGDSTALSALLHSLDDARAVRARMDAARGDAAPRRSARSAATGDRRIASRCENQNRGG